MTNVKFRAGIGRHLCRKYCVMDKTSYYEVALDWAAGRKGLISSPALYDSIEVATPPEFPNGVEGIWSPEHLLVAAVNGCLMTTFLAIAENSGLEFVGFHCKASGKLEKIDGKYLISEIGIRPELQIKSETQRGKALKVLEKAKEACLISNSIRSKIIFKPEINVS